LIIKGIFPPVKRTDERPEISFADDVENNLRGGFFHRVDLEMFAGFCNQSRYAPLMAMTGSLIGKSPAALAESLVNRLALATGKITPASSNRLRFSRLKSDSFPLSFQQRAVEIRDVIIGRDLSW